MIVKRQRAPDGASRDAKQRSNKVGDFLTVGVASAHDWRPQASRRCCHGLAITTDAAASAEAPVGASRDAEQRSNKVGDFLAVGGSFSSRLEAEGLPAVLPALAIPNNLAVSAKASAEPYA
ncbi:hypothetical protein [Halomonas alkalisoli]|uniref:hypothetical protein n=1 Tax=Halomonas alkalisoli TaxID=2907158 RepID=UPI001F28FC1F|nr:hypothetical protein [Halomonas alkalisoli]MCE9682746.1 hypothetical protein [Halomonas alkalisoli]